MEDNWASGVLKTRDRPISRSMDASAPDRPSRELQSLSSRRTQCDRVHDPQCHTRKRHDTVRPGAEAQSKPFLSEEDDRFAGRSRISGTETQPSDARKSDILSTSKGRKLQNSAAGDFHTFMASLFAGLSSEEQKGLLAGLERLVEISALREPTDSPEGVTRAYDAARPAKRKTARSHPP